MYLESGTVFFVVNLLDLTLNNISKSSSFIHGGNIAFLQIQDDFARVVVDALDDAINQLTQEEVLGREASLLQTSERDPPSQFTEENDEHATFLDECHSALQSRMLGQLTGFVVDWSIVRHHRFLAG